MAISISSRKAKGRNLQKEIAQCISDLTCIPCGKDELIESREMGQSGTDVKVIGIAKKLFPWAVECKRTETWTVNSYIKQAKDNSKGFYSWLLFIRKNRSNTITIIDSKIFKFLIKNNLVNYNIYTRHITRKNNWKLTSEIPDVEKKIKKFKSGKWAIKCGNRMCYTVIDKSFFFELYSTSKMFKDLKNEKDSKQS